jgi:cytochrome P450
MPGNTSIILATILMQRDKAVWGDDAHVFDPDRWADMGKEREGFMAWNYGPRMVRLWFNLWTITCR